MAVIWTRSVGDTRFEVRRAGRSVRLYTNGVFHSQYNPANPAAGAVWNLLMLPAFFRPSGSVRRVLLLGVGGGAVIRLLDHYVRPQRVIGVELDPTHLYIARRFFGVTAQRAELIEADAVDWLRRYRGPPFDLIIDDLFGEQDGEPVRAVDADRAWLARLARNLSDDGVLTMNFVAMRSLRDACRTLQQDMPSRFAHAFGLSLPTYENTVGAFVSQPTSARQLRQALRSSGTARGLELSRLPYRIRTVSP